MAYCETIFSGSNSAFNDNSNSFFSSGYTWVYDGTNPITISSEQTPGIDAKVYLTDGETEYDLSTPLSFDISISFFIKIVFNTTKQNFYVNVLNPSCNNNTIMDFNFTYEVL